MKKIGLLDDEESKKQCYIMVGQQIKFEPAWVTGKHKAFLEEANLGDCRRSATQTMNMK